MKKSKLVTITWALGFSLAAGAVDFNIPPQSLDSALLAFSEQADVQLSVAAVGVAGIRTDGIKGELSAEEGLAALLKNTGLKFTAIGKRTYSVTAGEVGSASMTEGRTEVPDGMLLAQTAESNVESEKSSSVESQSAGSQEGERTSIQEIIVTAQKREERLLDVPISVTALSGEALERAKVQSLADLNGAVPGLHVAAGGVPGADHIALRGLDTGGTSYMTSVMVDDIPMQGAGLGYAAGVPVLVPYDIDRIEVLNGPQGTLYGANAIGGVIRYVLNDPVLNAADIRLGAIANHIDRTDEPGGGVRAAMNLPVIDDVLAVRLSGYYQEYQGWANNPVLGFDHYNSYTQGGARLAVLWKLTDALSIKLGGRFNTTDSPGAAHNPVYNSAGVVVDPVTFLPEYGKYSLFTQFPTPFRQHDETYSATVDWDLGFATLTNLAAYQTTEFRDVMDITYGLAQWGPNVVDALSGGSGGVAYLPQTFDNRGYSNELRLASSQDDRFEWMIAAFYSYKHTSQQQIVYGMQPYGTLLPNINPLFAYAPAAGGTLREMALFTNNTYHFNNKFSVTFGLRGVSNSIDSPAYGFYGGLFGGVDPNNPPVMFPASRSDETNVTWAVSPKLYLSPDVMLYGRVATGYRPGGLTNAAPAANLPAEFTSDSLTNYEVGFKSAFLGGRLNTTVALFDVEWKKIQQSVRGDDGLLYAGNGKSARSKGLELSLAYQATDDLRLATNISYTDAHLTEDAPAVQGLDGARLAFGSKYTANFVLEYKHNITATMDLVAGGQVRYASDVWTGLSSAPSSVQLRQPQPVDMYVGLSRGHMDVQLHARNIFSSQPEVIGVGSPAFYASLENGLTYSPVQPLIVGLSVDFRY